MRRTLVLVGMMVLTSSVGAADPKPVWTADVAEKGKPRTGVIELGFAPDGRTLLVMTACPMVKDSFVWDSWLVDFDAQTHRELFRLDAGGVYCFQDSPGLAFPSADRVLTVSGGQVVLRDSRTGKPVSNRPGPFGRWVGAWSTVGGGYVLLDQDYGPGAVVRGTLPNGPAGTWMEADPRPAVPPKAPENGIRFYGVGVSPNGAMVAAYERDAVEAWSLKLYGLQKAKVPGLTTLATATDPHPGAVVRVQFSPDSRFLATGGMEGTVKLWDVTEPAKPWKPRVTLSGPDFMVTSLAFRPDGKVLAFGSSDKEKPNVWLVDVPTGKLVRSFRAGGTEAEVTALGFSPDGKTFATGTWRGLVEVWDVEKLLADR